MLLVDQRQMGSSVLSVGTHEVRGSLTDKTRGLLSR